VKREEPWRALSRREAGLDWERLEAYARELESWNQRIRLVGPKDVEGIRLQIEDALLPFLLCRPAFPLLDIGSGAGLPGIAIAIALGVGESRQSGPPVLCLEPQGKRVSFLRHVVRRLGLEGVEVVEDRAETAFEGRQDLRGRFSTVTARAVAEADTLLTFAAPYLASGGRVILPRGDEVPVERSGWRLTRQIAYAEPVGVGRRSIHVYEPNPK
jgi:16S rRNA (guanine527-N7)-methyltransferase